MKIENLSQHPEMIEAVTTWWFNQWSHLNSNSSTVEEAVRSLYDVSKKLSNHKFYA